MTDLAALAVGWAESLALTAHANGVSLNRRWAKLAADAGVVHPESVRLYAVQGMPRPENVELATNAARLGLLGRSVRGLTLGYAVIVLAVHQNNPRVLAHEFRHVYQYEQAGSLDGFLREYLRQLKAYGYWGCPLEADAREYEKLGLSSD